MSRAFPHPNPTKAGFHLIPDSGRGYGLTVTSEGADVGKPLVNSLAELLALPRHDLARLDVAEVNLRRAEGLPGAEDLDVAACLSTLDRWAESVRLYTQRTRGEYHARPDDWLRHKGYFAFACMATRLKHPKGLGVGYQPTAIGNYNFLDARDDFLHGPLTRRLGTCVSLPVLFVAVGRRLGYPMHLAVANGHVFCQWVDDRGRVNLEGSCHGGGILEPDEHYHTWPRPLTPAKLASGRYLRPLAPAEELCLFLETRGHVLTDHQRYPAAGRAYAAARETAPAFADYDAHMADLGRRATVRSLTSGPVHGTSPVSPDGSWRRWTSVVGPPVTAIIPHRTTSP